MSLNFGFLKVKPKYSETSFLISNFPSSTNCHIAIAVKSLDIEAVLYFVFSFEVLFNFIEFEGQNK